MPISSRKTREKIVIHKTDETIVRVARISRARVSPTTLASSDVRADRKQNRGILRGLEPF